MIPLLLAVSLCYARPLQIADLRLEPTDTPFSVCGHDRHRVSQMQKDQCLHIIGELDHWYEVTIPEQSVGHSIWINSSIRGWVHKRNVVKAGRCSCRSFPKRTLSLRDRKRIVLQAREYVGQAYLWGGLTWANPSSVITTGVNCSGLVYQSYVSVGFLLPRRSPDQCAVGMPIEPQELLPGDLIFYAPVARPVKHVMMWTGSDLIESYMSFPGGSVRLISFEERFGVALSSVKDGDIVQGKILFFRRYGEE